MPEIDRLVPRTFGVHQHIAENGERLPILVDLQTGLPPVVCLRFALYQRDMGSSARLELLLLRIADLLDWARFFESQDIDSTIFAGHGIRLDQITRALQDLELPSKLGAPINTRPRLRNQRCWAWSAFLEFVYRPGLWRTGVGVIQSHALRERNRADLCELLSELSKKRQSVPESQSRAPLSAAELKAIDEVLDSDDLCPFPGASRKRNAAMYRLARWAGPRIGEILKIKRSDLPQNESIGTKAVRQAQSLPRTIKIVRRPDDYDDRREHEPSVKRGSREIAIPDVLLEELLAYRDATQRHARSTYLFLTEDNSRPLSQSRANAVIQKIGESAAKLFQAEHGSEPHTLHTLTWHRLRHTRAIELLHDFFPEEDFEPGTHAGAKQLNSFLYYFGWASAESARPYLSRVFREDANARINRHLAMVPVNA